RRALEHSLDGWVDDDLAFVQPWGFSLESIQVPVHIWQGEHDRLVPWSHGQWLAEHIPGARFNLAKGEGHFSLGVANRDQILDALIDSQQHPRLKLPFDPVEMLLEERRERTDAPT
ncbi:MAG: alpha/beta hydrolase, partial [Chloroflexota bacterium]